MTSFTPEEQKKIDQLVDQWLAVDVNEQSRKEIQELSDAKNYTVLKSKMYPRISFGTAGLRSSMESGFAHMNDVTILQASQGLVSFILSEKSQETSCKNDKAPSLVIGYDHRFNSQRFAEITASVALASGLDVYYLGSVDTLSTETDGDSELPDDSNVDRSYVHTPMVPFGIDHYEASAGVMVTASHNPAKDNGYKVYYGNGCQIIPPHDSGIASRINENLTPWNDKKVWDVAENFKNAKASGQLKAVKAELTQLYIESVVQQLVRSPKVSYNFIYTPMHGVGAEIFGQICDTLAVNYAIVPEQARPDPNFSTVAFPNPEEAGALDLAISQAKEKGVKLVMANDPDADRFSVAVETKSGKWRQLTGNEIGILFAAYVIEEFTDPADLPNTYLVNSTVSSQLLRSIADQVGCKFQDTLTGFKWIGNKAIDLKQYGFSVPFGYEEAIGYMFGPVNDKDGVSASLVWLQLYESWFSSGKNDPIEKLEQIYQKYGWFKECNGYYKLDDVSKTPRIFKDIRSSYDFENDHPREIGDFDVVEWRDLTVGYESTTANHKPTLPVDASSQMITAVLKLRNTSESSVVDKVRFTCRGSGTEPKLKVYIEGSSQLSEETADGLARKCWETLKEHWFRPEENGLKEVL